MTVTCEPERRDQGLFGLENGVKNATTLSSSVQVRHVIFFSVQRRKIGAVPGHKALLGLRGS